MRGGWSRSYQITVLHRWASQLGTVPEELAFRSNRMSPAGIPIFYGADNSDSAIEEVASSSEDTHVTWCEFELTEDLQVVDLTQLQPEPSMSDPELGRLPQRAIPHI